MAVISTQNASSVKVKFDKGVNVNGDRVINTKTFSYIKSSASNEDIMAVVNSIVGLQKHTLSAVTRIDSFSLSE